MSDEPKELETGSKKSKKPKRSNEKPEKGNYKLVDPEAAHKKFMAVMFGFFFLVLLIMAFLNQYFDFAMDGGV